jgi:hypothetical protein
LSKAFVFFFALIQNSQLISQVDYYLYHIYRILNRNLLDKYVLESLQVISSAIRGRELSKINIFQCRTPKERARDQSFEEFRKISEENISQDDDFEVGIKKNSPFTKYYEIKIRNFKSLPNESSDIDNIANEFHCPKLFILLSDQLH